MLMLISLLEQSAWNKTFLQMNEPETFKNNQLQYIELNCSQECFSCCIIQAPLNLGLLHAFQRIDSFQPENQNGTCTKYPMMFIHSLFWFTLLIRMEELSNIHSEKNLKKILSIWGFSVILVQALLDLFVLFLEELSPRKLLRPLLGSILPSTNILSQSFLRLLKLLLKKRKLLWSMSKTDCQFRIELKV